MIWLSCVDLVMKTTQWLIAMYENCAWGKVLLTMVKGIGIG